VEKPGKRLVSRRVMCYEAAGFLFVILIIWLNELIDIPYLCLGAEQTPVNWRESVFETVLIVMLGVLVVALNRRLFRQMKYLEGTLPVCSSCKKIRDANGEWRGIETYISDRSDAVFTHGICPDCAEKLYPEYNPYTPQNTPSSRIGRYCPQPSVVFLPDQPAVGIVAGNTFRILHAAAEGGRVIPQYAFRHQNPDNGHPACNLLF